jgi:hypothetical protein
MIVPGRLGSVHRGTHYRTCPRSTPRDGPGTRALLKEAATTATRRRTRPWPGCSGGVAGDGCWCSPSTGWGGTTAGTDAAADAGAGASRGGAAPGRRPVVPVQEGLLTPARQVTRRIPQARNKALVPCGPGGCTTNEHLVLRPADGPQRLHPPQPEGPGGEGCVEPADANRVIAELDAPAELPRRGDRQSVIRERSGRRPGPPDAPAAVPSDLVVLWDPPHPWRLSGLVSDTFGEIAGAG